MEYSRADDYLYAGLPILMSILRALDWLLRNGVAVAALIIASLAYYRVHIRGADISVRPILTDAFRWGLNNWAGGLPHGLYLAATFLIVNEGPRTGTLESFRADPLTCNPRQPRAFTFVPPTGLWWPPEGARAAAMKPVLHPLVVRDGDAVLVCFRMETTLDQDTPLAWARDLRELSTFQLRYSYVVTSKGVPETRQGVADGNFQALVEDLTGHWRGYPQFADAIRALNG